jgi:dGTPase
MFASFASYPENSKGRLFEESDYQFRSIYGRDRDRIINSNAFRRLQYKTQVFVNHEGDHYRNRLTHSLEVSQIARWIASGLGCNKDLAEVISLAHDLGHTPFGHAGEVVLNSRMKKFGGFSHNAHTLKLITQLEKSYLNCEGLNLSWEMLEGVVKHNGIIEDVSKTHHYIQKYNAKHNLDLGRYPSIEGQISGISDDIAYNNHDIEDGMRAGLFEIKDLLNLPFIGETFSQILQENPNANHELVALEAKRKIVEQMTLDVISSTQENVKKLEIKNSEDVRKSPRALVSFSPKMEIAHLALKKFLMENMYRHYKVNRMSSSAKKIVGGLFDFFFENPDCLPEHGKFFKLDQRELAIMICDYIAGMTDRFALREYEELIG